MLSVPGRSHPTSQSHRNSLWLWLVIAVSHWWPASSSGLGPQWSWRSGGPSRSQRTGPKCREPAWRIPPMAKVMRKRPDGQKRDQASRGPPSRASTPKPKSVCFIISWLSPTPLTLTGGYPWPLFSGENQLRALANKSPGQDKSVSIQTSC